MKQSRRMSLVEAVANVVVGYGIAVATQAMVFPMFGLQASIEDNLLIGAIFTILCRAPHKMVYAERIVMRSSMVMLDQATAPEGIFWVERSS